jgi:chromosome segregation ATPase
MMTQESQEVLQQRLTAQTKRIEALEESRNEWRTAWYSLNQDLENIEAEIEREQAEEINDLEKELAVQTGLVQKLTKELYDQSTALGSLATNYATLKKFLEESEKQKHLLTIQLARLENPS